MHQHVGGRREAWTVVQVPASQEGQSISPDWHVAVGEEGTVVGGTEEGVGAGAGAGAGAGGRTGAGARGGAGAGATEATVAGDLATTTPAVPPVIGRQEVGEQPEQWLEEEGGRGDVKIALGQNSEPSYLTSIVEIDTGQSSSVTVTSICIEGSHCPPIYSLRETGGDSRKRNIPSGCPPPCGHKTRSVPESWTRMSIPQGQGGHSRGSTLLILRV